MEGFNFNYKKNHRFLKIVSKLILKGALTQSKSVKPEMVGAANFESAPEKSQLAVITSETQIKVIALPSQNCIHTHSISEGVVAKANVTVINCN